MSLDTLWMMHTAVGSFIDRGNYDMGAFHSVSTPQRGLGPALQRHCQEMQRARSGPVLEENASHQRLDCFCEEAKANRSLLPHESNSSVLEYNANDKSNKCRERYCEDRPNAPN